MLARKQPKLWTKEQYIRAILVQAGKADMYTQPKMDGLRLSIYNGEPVTRSMLELPNDFVRQAIIDARLPEGCDGEVVTIFPNGRIKSFNEIQSDLMTKRGIVYFNYYIFDYAPPGHLETAFETRYLKLFPRFMPDLPPWYLTFHDNMHLLNAASTVDNVLAVEKEYIEQGYEGVIFRGANSQYWCGPNRPTFRQASLFALTAWQTSEAIILDKYEEQINNNSVGRDAFGRVKRSKSIGSLLGADMLGGFVVRDVNTRLVFRVGSGYSDLERIEYWNADMTGQFITYKYKPHGQKDAPRHPIFLGIRRDL